MAPERRSRILLSILGLVVAGAVYTYWPRSSASTSAVASARRPTAGRPGAARGAAPEVHLETLEQLKPKPGDAERNLFRFEERVARSAPAPREAAVEMPPPGPPAPPPPPPIPLRFIGLVESNGAAKLAILSDGRGAPMYGKEGETVLGQYRIDRIGVESIDLSYLDGRGRQTIRLSGS